MFGLNCSNSLGTGNNQSTLVPKKPYVKTKSKGLVMEVAPFFPTENEVAILATACWGMVPSTKAFAPIHVNTYLLIKQFTELARASHCWMALAADGEVLAWSYDSCDQVGPGSTAHQITPWEVTDLLHTKRAAGVGHTSFMATVGMGRQARETMATG